MNRHKITYWIFQISGWTLYCLIFVFFYLSLRTTPQPYFFQQLLAHVIIGFLLTHFMRYFIQKTGILKLTLKMQVVSLVLTSLLFSFLIGICIVFAEIFLGIQSEKLKTYTILNITTGFAFSYFHFVLIWNLLYFTYHYIQKTRQQTIDQARLESLLKELEITTLKAHINPQFLFNSLNSIRSLVLDNPARARSAITELSNILRSSIQIDKAEKTMLEKELVIIKDYLSLEAIRLENHLHVTYTIEDDTLDMFIPAMVLQTLVENALKYGDTDPSGINRIIVFSDYEKGFHHFGVRSTGNIELYKSAEAHSFIDMQNRMELMYGKQVQLEIHTTNDALIEVSVRIPLT